MPRILIVDDDPGIRDVVRIALRREGFETDEAADGAEAVRLVAARPPDAIVLDILMPEMDGTEACRRIRARSDVPIVFLSSKDDEIDRVLGLELGGDDYVTKPFGARELVARVRAVLRRARPKEVEPGTGRHEQRHGRLRLDLDAVRAYWDDREVVLTVTEFGLLETLLRHPGRVYSRGELMELSYSDDRTVADRTIDSHIRRIRRKFAAFGADPIETSPGRGYKASGCG
jgi:two-component system OmpR family response regulator